MTQNDIPQEAAPKSTMNIRIDGLDVTLTVNVGEADERVTARHFTTAAEAGRVYDHFKARIQQAEVTS